jgi:hypothetical protein
MRGSLYMWRFQVRIAFIFARAEELKQVWNKLSLGGGLRRWMIVYNPWTFSFGSTSETGSTKLYYNAWLTFRRLPFDYVHGYRLQKTNKHTQRSWALLERLPVVRPTRYFPSILWNPKAQYRIHKSSPPVPIPSHTNLVHITPSQL